MTEFFIKIEEIYARLVLDMPLFIRTGFESFVSLFLFALILFFIFLILQTSANLIFKKGSRILPYGISLIAITFVFYGVFAPEVCIGSGEAPKTIMLTKLVNNEKKERYLFISEKEKAVEELKGCLVARSINTKPKLLSSNDKIVLTLTYSDGREKEITIGESGMYLQPLPKTGQILRCITSNNLLYEYVSQLNI